MKIAVGGMQHETNTFAPTPAGLDDFVQGRRLADDPVRRAALRGGRGRQPAGRRRDRRACRQPAMRWCRSPGRPRRLRHRSRGKPSKASSATCSRRLRDAMPVDGVYLDLHGAMVCEHVDDGEGEILTRVRALVGARVPVVASLDLHANVTRRMVLAADALTIYRTYPHVDMAATGERAARRLLEIAQGRGLAAKAFHAFDYLTPLPSQCTFADPARRLYELLETHRARARRVAGLRAGLPDGRFSGMPDVRGLLRRRRAACAQGAVGPGEGRGGRRAGFRADPLDARRRGGPRRPPRRTRCAGRPGGHPGQSGRRRQRRHHRAAGGDDRRGCARRGAGPADRPGRGGAGPPARAGRERGLPPRRDLGRGGPGAGDGALHRRAARRRPLRLHRRDVQGLPDEPGADGACCASSGRGCGWCSRR